jgi:hypothetical protein
MDKPWLLINVYTREIEGRYKYRYLAIRADKSKRRAAAKRYGGYVHVAFDIERTPTPWHS